MKTLILISAVICLVGALTGCANSPASPVLEHAKGHNSAQGMMMSQQARTNFWQ